MILLIGASGYVGQEFQKYFLQNNLAYLPYSIRFPINNNELTRTIINKNISLVINAAGYTGHPNIAACERPENKEECLKANAYLPLALSQICRKYFIPFAHISTGCLYTDPNCDRGLPPLVEYTEHHTPNFSYMDGNSSWYSGSKQLGEHLLKETNTMIFRIRLPFNGAVHKKNLIHKIVQYHKLLNTTNSYTNLTEFVELAYDCIINKRCTDFGEQGCIINATQPGYITTVEIVEILKDAKLIKEKEFFSSLEEFKKLDNTPRSNCVLDCTSMINKKIPLRHVKDSFISAAEEYSRNIHK
jgi:UDP-glucose 4,6-dehydratase